VTPAATVEITVRADTSTEPGVARIAFASGPESNDARPPLFVPREEILFWTRSWQAGEAESARARVAGHLRVFGSGAELVDWLEADDD
jgi:hypothetical protein